MKKDLSMHQRSQPQNEDLDAARIRMPVEPFRQTLAKHGLSLTREKTTTLQVNVGLLCNQACRHCHLEAGPNREEVMSKETVDQVVASHFAADASLQSYCFSPRKTG
jgi:sulfatase maturation enzyme AslB (radical SAM superfamily)